MRAPGANCPALSPRLDDLKSDFITDLGQKIEDVGKKVENLGKEIKTDLKLQREAMDLVVPELVSLRQKCRNKLKPKSPQQDHENRNRQPQALVRASS